MVRPWRSSSKSAGGNCNICWICIEGPGTSLIETKQKFWNLFQCLRCWCDCQPLRSSGNPWWKINWTWPDSRGSSFIRAWCSTFKLGHTLRANWYHSITANPALTKLKFRSVFTHTFLLWCSIVIDQTESGKKMSTHWFEACASRDCLIRTAPWLNCVGLSQMHRESCHVLSLERIQLGYRSETSSRFAESTAARSSCSLCKVSLVNYTSHHISRSFFDHQFVLEGSLPCRIVCKLSRSGKLKSRANPIQLQKIPKHRLPLTYTLDLLEFFKRLNCLISDLANSGSRVVGWILSLGFLAA